MSGDLKELHEDHENFSRILRIADQELSMLKRGEAPDFNLMLDMVDYIENYADLYHHPREDVIYERFLEKSNESRSDIETLMEEHASLRNITDTLRTTIEGFLHDAIVSKQDFIDQLEVFIDRQKQHLNLEEASIFPLIEKSFGPEDWTAVEKLVHKKNDPLFGAQVSAQYMALYERIRDEA